MKRAAILAILAVLVLAACDDPSFPPQACLVLQDTELFIGEQELVALCFQDPDGDAITVEATASDPSVVEAEVQSGGQGILLTGRDAGQAVITVVARDSNGLSAQQTFDVTVPNRPPEATALPDITLRHDAPEASLTLTEYFTDPDGHTLTFSAAVSDEAAIRASVMNDVLHVERVGHGNAVALVTATDPHGAQGQGSVQVKLPNRAPVVTGQPDPLLIPVGSSLTVTLSDYFEDPDGQELTYSAESSNAAAVTASVVGDAMTVTAVGLGNATLTIIATDGEARALLTMHAAALGGKGVVFEDDFDPPDSAWVVLAVNDGKVKIEDGKLKIWSPTETSQARVGREDLVAVDWFFDASIRAATDVGVEVLIGWPTSEAGYHALVFLVGDIAPRTYDPGRYHYCWIVLQLRSDGEAIRECGVLDDYDYLEYTTISAGLDDGELVLEVGDTEVGRVESQYVGVAMVELTIGNRPPWQAAGDTVFVDWVRVTGRAVAPDSHPDVSMSGVMGEGWGSCHGFSSLGDGPEDGLAGLLGLWAASSQRSVLCGVGELREGERHRLQEPRRPPGSAEASRIRGPDEFLRQRPRGAPGLRRRPRRQLAPRPTIAQRM